ncbi:MAG: anthranilate phosphoribosyltransferase [Austwickia sp.]|nr:anthranilate phosphoribosyltransferase [Actinomycetota bacterium]MCB1252033.1 anthranilate phosphoribosyltransferase [Austwickia sp.]
MAVAEPTWPDVLSSLLAGQDLDPGTAAWAMGRIMSGDAAPSQVAAFVVALRAKGETVDEVTGIAGEMLAHAHRIEVPGPSLDVVGTGGDRAHTVNISTMAAVTCAAAGATVVKHGNRAASSTSGTADVLEALGVNLKLTPSQVADVARTAGITFCFAQVFHPSFRHTAGPRKDIGIPTVFNVLGPLTNPAQPDFAAVGVADVRLAPLVAGVFASRGKDTAVFRGRDGLDELTISTTSQVWWVRSGAVHERVVDPERLGLTTAPLASLRGGSPAENAQVVRDTFAGARGPIRDAVVLNAGIALAIMGADSGTDQAAFEVDLRAAMDRAEAVLDGGEATRKLADWSEITRTLASAG